MIKRILIFSFILGLAACGGKKPVSINTLRPANITIDSHIQKVLVIDRTKPSERDRWINIGEGVLTGEGIMADRAAAQELVNSLKNSLQNSPRFQTTIANERYIGNSLTAVFPEPIPLHEQHKLLRTYKVDAIVALEILDTDFIITDGQRTVKKKVSNRENRNEVEKEVNEWFAKGVGNIKVGMRVYDPHRRQIIDQQLLSNTQTWEATGESKQEALAALIVRDEAVRNLCRKLGHDYAFKIAPMPVSLRRLFFTKSKNSPELEEGGRMAEVGAWNDAINKWEEGIIKAEKEKDKARMAYNIAVAYEVLGDLDKALEAAQNAYSKYNSKEARNYAQQIQSRMRDEEKVDQQLR